MGVASWHKELSTVPSISKKKMLSFFPSLKGVQNVECVDDAESW